MPTDSFDRPVFDVLERTTPRFHALLVADDEVTPIPGSLLTTLTLTLYVEDFELTIVNGRNHQNVLQTGGVTVSEAGELIWQTSAADVAILNDTLPFERHVALFEWTWPVDKVGKYEFVYAVRNLQRVA